MRPGSGHLLVPTSLKNEAPTALLQCLSCQSASSTPHPQALRPDPLQNTPGKVGLSPLLTCWFPPLYLGPRSSRLGSSCCPDWRSGMLNPAWPKGLGIPLAATSLQSHPNLPSTQIQAVPFPGKRRRKPAGQEHRTWDEAAGIHCSLGAARGQLKQLYGAGQHCIGMWGGRKGAWLGCFRAAGQDQAVLAEPAGRGSC